MIRKLLTRLHILRPKPEIDPLTTIIELVPVVMACGMFYGMAHTLGLTFRIPWYCRLRYKLKWLYREIKLKLME